MEVFAFTDLLEPGPPICVLARVRFLATEEGGRSSPITGIYRPSHNFGAPDGRQFYIGQLVIPEGAQILPGETHDLYVTFLNGAHLAEQLRVGRSWRIQDGARHVATAEVLAVVGEP